MASSSTTGTSTYTLGSAITGYQAWSVVGDGNSAYYCAQEVDGSGNPSGDFEVGLGTYATSGTTLTRDTILASSNAGAAVNWAAGTRRIFLTLPAGQVQSILPNVLRGSIIDGLTLSNNATDANNDIDIAVGCATVTDGTTWFVATLASALTKRLDAAWAVGTNQGGLDTGSEAVSTGYHVWLIQRSDTLVVDVLFSASATAPTMPADYDRKRRIGWVFNDASGNILAFFQQGDRFIYSVQRLGYDTNNPGTSAVLRTLPVPLGIEVEAILAANTIDNSYAGAQYCLITYPGQADTVPAVSANTYNINASGQSASIGVTNGVVCTIRTNTSGQVRVRVSLSDTDITPRGYVIGWIDPRGRT